MFWGFSISSMDVIILLFVASSLHSMLILLCVMLCVMSLIPVSIYRFSLGVDVGSINTRFIMLSSILLIVPFSSLFGSHSSHAYVIMGIMQVSISFHIVPVCMPFRVGSPAIVRMVWSAPSAFLFEVTRPIRQVEHWCHAILSIMNDRVSLSVHE